MPGPAVPLAIGGALFIAWLLGRKKTEAPGTSADIVDVGFKKEPDVYNPPPPIVGDVAKRWAYIIQSGDTPLGLAKAWTGDAGPSRMDELETENKGSIEHANFARVTYYPNDPEATGVAQIGPQDTILTASAQGHMPITVTSSTPAGANFPNNPLPGSEGYWKMDRGPDTFSPWNANQVLAIPASWGNPKTSLTGAKAAP